MGVLTLIGKGVMSMLTVPVVFAVSFGISLVGAIIMFRITHNYKATAIVSGGAFLFSVAYGLAGMLE